MEVGAYPVQRGDVVKEFRDRLVVLVDEDDYLLGRRLCCSRLQEILKVLFCSFVLVERNSVFGRKILHERTQVAGELLVRRTCGGGHREGHDRKRLVPLPRQLVDGKPLEELASALEHRLQGREHERLAEPPRTRDEQLRVRLRRGKLVQQFRLVDVLSLPPEYQPRKVEHARRGHLDSALFVFHRHVLYQKCAPLCGKN